ncbi:cadherin-like beta sandwich domain-containing protein, partial [Odoribacter sp. OttesenSCG-928-L07]|nr:cadherin-like beta sandwich domain-containing protein [Odoribacter sp. OttesenSCG-928-L07]
TLLSLEVSDGVLNPEFTSNHFQYNVTVGYYVEDFIITAVANHENASINGNGSYIVDFGDNTIIVTVTAEDDIYTQTYTINVYRQSSDATLLSLDVSHGELDSEFSSSTFEYDVTVGYAVDEIEIYAITNDPNATVNGDGLQTLEVGDNTFFVTVTAEDEAYSEVYTINVYRLSGNATLSNLVISYGNLDPAFSSNQFEYDVTVGYDVYEINITAETNDVNANIDGDGLRTVFIGNNIFTVTVTAEDPSISQNYVIQVYRQSNVVLLYYLWVNPGSFTPSFDTARVNYSMTVDYDVASITINATPFDSRATITGDGPRSLEVGDNVLDVVVTAEDPSYTKTYTINAHRNSNDATLESLSVSHGTLDPSFSPGTLEYEVRVNSYVDEIDITAIANHANATIEGDGIQTLEFGSNSFDIVVSAEDDTYIQTYTINVYRESNDATLLNLDVSYGELDPEFASSTFEYDVTVDYAVNQIEIYALTNNPNATVNGHGLQTLGVGDNTFIVTVIAEDEAFSEIYTINVYRLSGDATLSNLAISNGNLNPVFSSNNFEYDVTVGYYTDEIEFFAIANHENATIEGDGLQTVALGDNSFEIVVTAEDDIYTQTYTINVYRQSNDASLADLVISQGELDPGFDANTFEYDVTVGYDVDEIYITAVLNDENASIYGDGNHPLNVGDNSFEIIVTAEDDTFMEIYTINIYRLSGDVTLFSLDVSHGELDPEFASSTFEYDVTVNYAVDEIEIFASSNDPNAIVLGDGLQILEIGNNTFYVTVIAEDETYIEYYIINVYRLSDDATLSSLDISDGNLDPAFSSNQFEYYVTLGYDVDEIYITAVANNENASIYGDGNHTLEVGDNSFNIIVTAEDDTFMQIYTINIYRQSNDASLSILDVLEGNLNPEFVATTFDYEVIITDEVEEINIIAVANDENAELSGDFGMINLPTGDHVFTITVTAEDNSYTQDYTITVRRKSDDAKLL